MHQKLIDKFKLENPNKQLILFYVAGSHFFDLNGPNSDKDYRGLYIDSHQDSFSSSKGKIYVVKTKTNDSGGKNSKDDIDVDIFSVCSLLELLKKGDFNLIEALYAPEDKILYKSALYDELREFRSNLVHNDISAFLGFIRTEANKVGVNSHHYEVQMNFLKILENKNPHAKLRTFWKEIEDFCADEKNTGVKISRSAINNSDLSKEMPAVVIAARMHQWTASAGYVTEAIKHVISGYGHRQKSTADTGGDFKTLYHSLRLIFEANDILDYGELSFPLSQERRDKLLEIKNGKSDPDELFGLINEEIAKLIVRSQNVVSNKKDYEHKLDQMIFTLKGRFEVNNLIRNTNWFGMQDGI